VTGVHDGNNLTVIPNTFVLSQNTCNCKYAVTKYLIQQTKMYEGQVIEPTLSLARLALICEILINLYSMLVTDPVPC